MPEDQARKWPETGEKMQFGIWPMKLSYKQQSITLGVEGWWAREANDGILAGATLDLVDRVMKILKARDAGLRITLVAAADDGWGIGLCEGLPWRCREDMQHFKKRTMGLDLFMGRKTYEGLPVTLVGRRVHVASRRADPRFASVDRAICTLIDDGAAEIIVAGGGALYADALAYCTHAEVTRIPGLHGCDTVMPDLAAFGWGIRNTTALTDDINIQYWEPNA